MITRLVLGVVFGLGAGMLLRWLLSRRLEEVREQFAEEESP